MASLAGKEKDRDKGTKDEKPTVTVGEKRKADDSKLSKDSADTKTSLLSIKVGKKTTTTSPPSAISIKVGQMKSTETSKKKAEIISKPKKGSVAAAFNDESDEEEEIPREAKMRMRNLGKDTATSSGPNSFNKGKKGFTNYGKLMEKEMKLVKDKYQTQ